MCFRPTEISIAMKCPECGMTINPVAGVIPEECPYCEYEGMFEPITDDDSSPEPAGSPVAAAPGTPAPGVPSAPSM